MKVSIIGKQYPDSFASCMAAGFEALGHHVQTVDDQRFPLTRTAASARMGWAFAAQQSSFVAGYIARAIEGQVVPFKPDLVVSVSKTLRPDVVERIKDRTGAKCVFWFPDAVSNLGRQYFISSPFDLYCFKDLLIVRALERIGLRAMLLPDAARLLVRPHPVKPHVDLLIACNLYPYRARLLEHLQDFSWEIYGNVPRWLRSPVVRFHKGRYLAGVEKVTAYQSAAIVFNNNHPAEVEGINARTFEVCGAGAFLLTDAHPALPTYYEPGVEVGVYTSVRDVVEAVRYYLARPELRYQMADRAYERTAREHTYECRIRTMLNELASLQ